MIVAIDFKIFKLHLYISCDTNIQIEKLENPSIGKEEWYSAVLPGAKKSNLSVSSSHCIHFLWAIFYGNFFFPKHLFSAGINGQICY